MMPHLRYATLVFAFTALTSRYIILADDELALLASLTPCELVRYYGYPCELSYATTDDGYELEVDRIRHGRESCPSPGCAKSGRRRRHPVLLLPALMTASDMWFLNYPWQSPGFLFADADFDVWAMNSRESYPYSDDRTLSKPDPHHWQWRQVSLFSVLIEHFKTFDEIGRHDLAAVIDHVLEASGAPKVTLLAMSQGVTIALVLLRHDPSTTTK
ncbi:hypothetical protein HPB50_026173 [Hyalomma asiaticum]|uniref:Uncharacterized protein n=1 Tax=Hyalomma asiaticum TaxID=266040 RepID=A0ACB7S6D2_HYAAI|nr:hypothetical protein HPB50_026173 [Hyalomma asiaticum]